jgi:hypothetical protein
MGCGVWEEFDGGTFVGCADLVVSRLGPIRVTTLALNISDE